MATDRLTKDEFSTLTKQLEAAYRTKMSQAERDAYWTIWKQFPFDVLTKALAAYMGSDQADFFPKAPSIVPHADRMWQERQHQRHAEIKQSEAGGFKQLESRYEHDDVGQASLALIFDLLNDRITKAQYVEGLRGLHDRWPTLGFDHSARTVEDCVKGA